MPIRVKQLMNCNLYAEGGSFLGALNAITLPDMKHKASEHKAGDGIGTPKLPGSLEALQTTLKMNGMYEDFHALTADPTQMRSLMVRANQRVRSGVGDITNEPVIIYLRGWFSSRKIGELKSSDPTNPEYVMELYYFRLNVSGADIEEVDIENAVHRVLGQDVLADYRSNLGID
jgi:hypothetical protein